MLEIKPDPDNTTCGWATFMMAGVASSPPVRYRCRSYEGEERPGSYNDLEGWDHLHGFYMTRKWTLRGRGHTLIFTMRG